MEPITNELNRRFKNHPEFRQRYQQLIDTTLKDEDVRHFLETHRSELAPETVDRGMSKLYEFVQTKKALAAGNPLPYRDTFRNLFLVSIKLKCSTFQVISCKLSGQHVPGASG